MHLWRRGEHGVPVLVFPTEMGNCRQWEDFGVLDAFAEQIASGHLHFWCVDTIDDETFFAPRTVSPTDRARRHQQYEAHILDEVVGMISENRARLIVAGAAFGAAHAVMLATRRPWEMRAVYGIAGRYDVSRRLSGLRDGEMYYCDPFAFVPNLSEEKPGHRVILESMRRLRVEILVGTEDPMESESRELEDLLRQKQVDPHRTAVPGPFSEWSEWTRELVRLLPAAV